MLHCRVSIIGRSDHCECAPKPTSAHGNSKNNKCRSEIFCFHVAKVKANRKKLISSCVVPTAQSANSQMCTTNGSVRRKLEILMLFRCHLSLLLVSPGNNKPHCVRIGFGRVFCFFCFCDAIRGSFLSACAHSVCRIVFVGCQKLNGFRFTATESRATTANNGPDEARQVVAGNRRRETRRPNKMRCKCFLILKSMTSKRH